MLKDIEDNSYFYKWTLRILCRENVSNEEVIRKMELKKNTDTWIQKETAQIPKKEGLTRIWNIQDEKHSGKLIVTCLTNM